MESNQIYRLLYRKGHYTKYVTSMFQSCQCHDKQGKSEILPQMAGTKEMVKCNMASWMGFQKRKMILREQFMKF